MRIAAGWDHRGRQFSERLERLIGRMGHKCVDMGAPSEEPADYPDYAFAVAEAVSRGECDRGILICGTGIGVSMAANKVKGIRAAVVHDEETARLSRAHNDANVLCLGGPTAGGPLLEAILKTWLTTAHEGGRHTRRVQKIMDYERRCQAGQSG